MKAKELTELEKQYLRVIGLNLLSGNSCVVKRTVQGRDILALCIIHPENKNLIAPVGEIFLPDEVARHFSDVLETPEQAAERLLSELPPRGNA